jgi:hypothetical protein
VVSSFKVSLTKIVYAFLIATMRFSCPTHPIRLQFAHLNNICRQVQIMKFLFCSLLLLPLLDPNSLFRTIPTHSNISVLRYAFRAIDRISHQYYTRSKIRVNTFNLYVSAIRAENSGEEPRQDFCKKNVKPGPDRDVGVPGRLIIWLPFKTIFFKYLFNTSTVEYISDLFQ